jgi:hypothetical protein
MRFRQWVRSRRTAFLHLIVSGTAALLVPLSGVAGTALTAAFVAWVLIAAGHVGYAFFDHFVRRALEGYPELSGGASGVVMTGSLSSTVRLDIDRGVAEKRYDKGTRFVRWLYRLSFQAPFPYTTNVDALEAARHRRAVVGLLTEFWFGTNLVAQVIDVRPEADGRYTFVTELVPGSAPRDREAARALLRALTARFLEAGLPCWQVAHYNPRAIGNLIQLPDGTFRIIDLESNLVTPFLPPAAIVRAIRLAQYPSFDDIDIPRLRAYLDDREAELVDRLGRGGAARLHEAVSAYASAQAAWFASEPRIPSRVLRFCFRLVDVPGWARGLRGFFRHAVRGSRQRGETFIQGSVEQWVAEGRLTDEEARDLRAAVATPEVAAVLANLGIHLAITIPLRFPFGALTRFFWTASARLRAEWQALRRRQSASSARRVHTLPVMFATLLPGVGAGAYLLATPLRSNRTLEFVALDRLVRRLPVRLYERLHVSTLTTWLAHPRSEHHDHTPRAVREGIRLRLAAVAPVLPMVLTLMLVNAVVLAVAAVLHHRYDESFAFEERGLIATLDAVELIIAGVLGLVTFRLFWRDAYRHASLAESAGMFLWGLSGIGMLFFAVDDFLSIHERLGRWVDSNVRIAGLLTNNVDDLITLSYGLAGLACVALFREELLARRASSALYLSAVLAAAAMLLVDAFVRGDARALEFPLQVGAVALLLAAHVARYGEVRRMPHTAPRADARAVRAGRARRKTRHDSEVAPSSSRPPGGLANARR